jgi:hypothetical protein
VNQRLTTGRTWYVSSPVTSALPTVASGTFESLSYDEPSSSFLSNSSAFVVGKGYVSRVSADGNITFNGTLKTGNVPVTLSATGSTQTGFNLVGNPYPSYLDWTKVCDYTLDAGATHPNLSIMPTTTMWYRTKLGGVYSFWTVNGDNISCPSGANPQIPPMQAFWVRANAGGNLALTNAMRTHAPATDKLLKAPSSKNANKTLLRLQVSNGTNADETVVYFSSNASNALDKYDSPKMSNNNLEIPEIYTTVGTEQLVINGMNTILMDTPIGLGFVAGSANSFTIKANEISNFPTDVKVILKDNVTLTETDLTNGITSYQFSPEEVSGNRFSVIFKSSSVTTGVDASASDKVTMYVYQNAAKQLVVNSNENEGVVNVYSAIGQRLVNVNMSGKTTVIPNTLNAGVYYVQVQAAGNTKTQKVVVK